MKKLKKWLAAALAAAVVSTAGFTATVSAQSSGYQRWDTVAEEERVRSFCEG